MENFMAKIPKSLNPKSAPLPQSAERSTSPTSSERRRTARARRTLPPPSDRAMSARTGLPDEIWEQIFLRLDAAADLARASAACSSFHCIVSEPRFRRRFLSLRSPAVLGFITSIGSRQFFPVGSPHRSAPEARALGEAADFTFSFLPGPCGEWCFCHASDGRVLLSKRISFGSNLEDFVVCDPLYRRYVEIPRMPDDLLASAGYDGFSHRALSILAPAGESDEEGSFRVICTMQHKDKVVVFIFSSCNQTWRISTISLPDGLIDRMTYYAHGCLYWMVDKKGYSLMLDTSDMKFSTIDLPPHNFGSMRAIVEAADGRLGFLTIADGTIDLYCKNWKSNCVGAQEWLHDKLIPLPKHSGINCRWDIVGAAGHYFALIAHLKPFHNSRLISEHFVLDIKTLLVENLWTSKSDAFFGLPYARFPPPLALPSI